MQRSVASSRSRFGGVTLAKEGLRDSGDSPMHETATRSRNRIAFEDSTPFRETKMAS